jgi:hypothetical protein
LETQLVVVRFVNIAIALSTLDTKGRVTIHIQAGRTIDDPDLDHNTPLIHQRINLQGR